MFVFFVGDFLTDSRDPWDFHHHFFTTHMFVHIFSSMLGKSKVQHDFRKKVFGDWFYSVNFQGDSPGFNLENCGILYLPSSKLPWHWKITIFNREYIFNPGPFSIAMLVYQRVCAYNPSK